MDYLTQWIADHPVVTTWITLISLLGVIATLIALFLQIKYKNRMAIYYNISSTLLVDNKASEIQDIKILFQNKEVDTVLISKIKLWNGGNVIIEKTNFYDDHELRIVVPTHERILAVALEEESEDTCKVDVIISNQCKNQAIISFDCFEPGQGAIINVYHTNADEKTTDLSGKLKGGKILNKTIELAIEEGVFYVSTSNYKFGFNGSILNIYRNAYKFLKNFWGVSIKRIK